MELIPFIGLNERDSSRKTPTCQFIFSKIFARLVCRGWRPFHRQSKKAPLFPAGLFLWE
jgi:hypothetical protein